MTLGAGICLGLVGLLLGGQIFAVVQLSRSARRSLCSPPVNHRLFLDRKAEIECDARKRF